MAKRQSAAKAHVRAGKRDDAKRKASSTKRTFATVELARSLKARGYSVNLRRKAGYSVVQGAKTSKSGGRRVTVMAMGKGRKLATGSMGGTTINRTGPSRGYQRLVGNPAKPKGPGIRTAKQRAASIANLRKARSSRMRKSKR